MTWWDLFFRLPSGFPGGRCVPDFPGGHFATYREQARNVTPPPFRDDVGSRHGVPKKADDLRQNVPPAFAGGAEWCYLDMWISTRGVEGVAPKNLWQKEISRSVMCRLRKKVNRGEVRHCPKGVKHESWLLDPGTVSRKFCTPKGCTPKKVQDKEKIESQKLSLRPCKC